jgi:hypothetical protein
MDLMTDIFQQAGLRRRVLGPHRVAAGVALRFPCSKSMGLHVVTQGPLHLHAPDLPQPLRLVRGDIAFMARGCDHALAVPDTLHGRGRRAAAAARRCRRDERRLPALERAAAPLSAGLAGLVRAACR